MDNIPGMNAVGTRNFQYDLRERGERGREREREREERQTDGQTDRQRGRKKERKRLHV